LIITTQDKTRAGAFTLPEVLIAAGLIGLSGLALFAGFRQSFNLIQTDRENLRATQILQEKMEIIRLYSWAQVTNAGFIPSTFTDTFNPTGGTTNSGVTYTGTVIVTNAPITQTYSNDLRLVNISLSWTNGVGTPHTREMTTLVARYGLQNYIY
jgi:type II secretory pathway pseudopilin PulG